MPPARLRHIAINVSDLERSAAFYQEVFGLERVGEETIGLGSAIYLSDGHINFALLKLNPKPGEEDKPMPIGTNHFGFQVENVGETQAKIEAAGGTFFFDLGDERKGNFERKMKDLDGVVFDISGHGWQGTDSYSR